MSLQIFDDARVEFNYKSQFEGKPIFLATTEGGESFIGYAPRLYACEFSCERLLWIM